MIRFIDDTLARVFAKMDELGLTDNTVIVFTSDHGDVDSEA
ncbi:sulfatase-like hydrolase/transferase [Paenibacillus sp. Soil766]|nr:sulfatase-like hydrolase/transferase [Paenibacillus sp. Soil766]